MERRQFIRGLCSGVVAWPLAAYAQQVSNPRRIGVLGADATVWRPWTTAFVARLRELGWLEGETIAIDYRWAEGSSQRVSEIAAEFLRQNVDVIVTLWKRGHDPKAGDNDHSYRLCCGLRSGSWRPCSKLGQARWQRYRNVDPTARPCRQAA